NQQGFNAWQNGRIQGAQNAGVQSGGNQNGLVVVPGIANQSGTGNVVAARAEGDLDEIKEVNANCILMANLQQASTSSTQHDRAPVYDTDGSAEVHLNDNCYDNEIFNMFTQEEQYTDLLEPIPEQQLVPQNDNHVTSVAPSMVHSGGTVETSSAPNKEICAHQETVYRNLVDQVAQEEARIQLQAEEFDFMAAACDLNEIEEVNANCIFMANLQHASTSGTQLNKAPIYDTHGSAKVQLNDNCYDNEIFNMFTQEEQYTDLLEPIPEQQLVPQNDNHVTYVAPKYVILWNNWYTKCEECKYDKISYDKAYNDMQQKVKRLQAQLRDLKGKSSNTPSASNTLDLLNQKLESKIVELEFQVVNYEREISHLKTTYKNLFDSIKSNRKNTSGTSVTPHVDKPKLSAVTPHSKKLHASTQSHSVPQPRKFNVIKHRNVIAPRIFKINPSQTPRVDLPKGKTRNARIPYASKSSEVKKVITVEDHRRTLLLSKNWKTMSSECNKIKLAIQNDKSEIVYDICKQCLVTANHDACLTPSMNVLNSRANKLCDNILHSANQKRHRTHVWRPKQVGSKERLAPKPRLPRFSLKWSPSGRSFDLKGKLVASMETNFPNDDKDCTSNPQEPMRKRFPNSTMFLGRLSKFVCGASTRVVPCI
nr:hypothetical protein [Tanacetum cinerariifolium]